MVGLRRLSDFQFCFTVAVEEDNIHNLFNVGNEDVSEKTRVGQI